MKTILELKTGLSKYLLSDISTITLNENNIITDNYIINDLNINNAVVIENIVAPQDWIGCKYFYKNDIWIEDPQWNEAQLVFLKMKENNA